MQWIMGRLDALLRIVTDYSAWVFSDFPGLFGQKDEGVPGRSETSVTLQFPGGCPVGKHC